MNKKGYTIISLGNYESKILCCTSMKDEILPFYKKTFLTNSFFENSIIIDFDLFREKLKEEIDSMPISINSTNVIINIPIKELNIKNYISDEFYLNENLSKSTWDKIILNVKNQIKNDNDYILDFKTNVWIIDNKEYFSIPLNKKSEKFSFKSKIYYIKKEVIKTFTNIFNSINVRVDGIIVDSLVLFYLFEKPERRFKLLLNVGHSQSTFEFFDNNVLSNQEKINFGIKDLTKEICELTKISEIESINLLKAYKDIVFIDKEIPMLNNFKEKFLEFSQIKIKDINVLIINWLKLLIIKINDFIEFLFSINCDVDELYFYSSTEIFDTWINYIQPKLLKFLDLKILKVNLIGINESKFVSLIATLLYFINNN